MRIACLICCCLIAASCASDGVGVVEKVKYDFGIGEKPEGYESVTDKILVNMENIGKTEMKRMNVAGRHGEIKFQQDSGLTGKYYKEVKVYEDARPMEAMPITRGTMGERGFVGYIQYSYRVYQSERKSNRTEAQAESANISTDVAGRETYRYTFGPGGAWDGKPGELTNR